LIFPIKISGSLMLEGVDNKGVPRFHRGKWPALFVEEKPPFPIPIDGRNFGAPFFFFLSWVPLTGK